MASLGVAPLLAKSTERTKMRLPRYRIWALQKKLAELSSQAEALILESRQLLIWQQEQQPVQAHTLELTSEDQRMIEQQHRTRLASIIQKHCMGMLRVIASHKWAFPFDRPVDTAQYPDYLKVVKTPMDLDTVKNKIEMGQYNDPHEFWIDVQLIFGNARKYNPAGSDVYLMADTLQELSDEKWEKTLLPRIAEETAARAKDEAACRRRRADIVNQASAEVLEQHAAALLGATAAVLGEVCEAKSIAASICEPLTLEEKEELVRIVRGLPGHQLEAVIGLLKACAPHTVDPSNNRLSLNMGKYDALTLRQLQHMLCSLGARPAAQSQPALLQPHQVLQPPQQVEQQAEHQPMAAAAAAAAAVRCVAPVPAAAAGVSQQLAAAAGSPFPPTPPAASLQADRTGGGSVQGHDPMLQVPSPPQDSQAAAAGGMLPGVSPASGTAAMCARWSTTGAPTYTRTISPNVLKNHSVSARSGIRWPGIPLGSGVRARARSTLNNPQLQQQQQHHTREGTPSMQGEQEGSLAAADTAGAGLGQPQTTSQSRPSKRGRTETGQAQSDVTSEAVYGWSPTASCEMQHPASSSGAMDSYHQLQQGLDEFDSMAMHSERGLHTAGGGGPLAGTNPFPMSASIPAAHAHTSAMHAPSGTVPHAGFGTAGLNGAHVMSLEPGSVPAATAKRQRPTGALQSEGSLKQHQPRMSTSCGMASMVVDALMADARGPVIGVQGSVASMQGALAACIPSSPSPSAALAAAAMDLATTGLQPAAVDLKASVPQQPSQVALHVTLSSQVADNGAVLSEIGGGGAVFAGADGGQLLGAICSSGAVAMSAEDSSAGMAAGQATAAAGGGAGASDVGLPALPTFAPLAGSAGNAAEGATAAPAQREAQQAVPVVPGVGSSSAKLQLM